MENETCKKKTTAPDTSVGADDGQSLLNLTVNSISAFEEEINGDFQNSSESLNETYRRIQRLTDPHYLHTISMTELYQTAYQSRPPIIDGLLYAGTYILAGVPKIGKSFLVAQIAYHVSTGKALWDYEVQPGTVLYLALEDDFQRIQSRMFIHLFVSRDKVFEKESVLQETIIIKAKKMQSKPNTITITTTQSNADFSNRTVFEAPYSTVVNGDESYVYLMTNTEKVQTLNELNRWTDTLPDIGLKRKTGLTVDFRNREALR